MIELYRMLRFIIKLNHDRQSRAINDHEPIRVGSAFKVQRGEHCSMCKCQEVVQQKVISSQCVSEFIEGLEVCQHQGVFRGRGGGLCDMGLQNLFKATEGGLTAKLSHMTKTCFVV